MSDDRPADDGARPEDPRACRRPRRLEWICDSPSPYNGSLFRALAADAELDLTVHFIRGLTGEHPWHARLEDGFRSRFFRRRAGADWVLARSAISDAHGLWIVGSWYEPTTQAILTGRAALGRPFVIWTDTPVTNKKRGALKARARAAWLAWIFRRATRVMGTGRPAVDVLRAMGAPSARLLNFPYFIDVGSYATSRETPGRPLEFLSSGRLHPDKGYDLALRALAAVLGGRPSEFRYRIAGTGAEQGRLEELARTLRIADRVEFLGWQQPEALTSAYASADVFLHPARSEPYGVTVLEAMASGLVVVGSDATAAVLDRIDHGSNGFIHHAGDAEDLARQISTVLSDPGRIPALKRAARERAEEWPISRGVAMVRDLAKNA